MSKGSTVGSAEFDELKDGDDFDLDTACKSLIASTSGAVDGMLRRGDGGTLRGVDGRELRGDDRFESTSVFAGVATAEVAGARDGVDGSAGVVVGGVEMEVGTGVVVVVVVEATETAAAAGVDEVEGASAGCDSLVEPVDGDTAGEADAVDVADVKETGTGEADVEAAATAGSA